MSAQRIRKIFTVFLLCLLVLTFSCKQETSISTVSQEMCECYNKRKGDDMDARMQPCVDAVVKSRKAEMIQAYSRYDPDEAVTTFLSVATVDMITSCDAFGSKAEIMYDAWYPVDSSAINLKNIGVLTAKLQASTVSDTTKKILHALIASNIKSRRLEEGLNRCQQMKKLFKQEEGAYFASAYVYSLQKKYNVAIDELEQEISLGGDKNLELFIAIIKRKAQRNKSLIN
jgi:hypothetical protein